MTRSSRSDIARRLPRLGHVGLADLPDEIPIFPLPGALLLPGGRLPLNIFEPRYIAMVDDALAGSRLIGMIQPEGETGSENGEAVQRPDEEKTRLFSIGCLARITEFTELPDGRYGIVLLGLCRFARIEERALAQGYRCATARYTAFEADLLRPSHAVIDREPLLDALRVFFAMRQIEARWDAIEQMDDLTLVTTLSMMCPFTVAEKQALLEAPLPEDRAQTLLALLEMAQHESDEDRPHRAS